MEPGKNEGDASDGGGSTDRRRAEGLAEVGWDVGQVVQVGHDRSNLNHIAKDVGEVE